MQDLRYFTCIVEMCLCKIAREWSIRRCERHQMRMDGFDHLICRDEVALRFRKCVPIRCACEDPTSNRVNLGGWKRRLFERHLRSLRRISKQSFIELGCPRIPWNDALCFDQRLILHQKIVCIRSKLPVAIKTTRLKNSIRLLCDILLCIKALMDSGNQY